MILTVGNTKGGVGKTTLALQLALHLARAGSDVLAVDGDRQGTMQAAITARSEAGRAPGLACAWLPEGPALRAQLQAQRSKYEHIVIDVGGRDSSALRAALVLTETLLVPFAPRSFDVWALEDLAELVAEANSLRDGLRVLCVLNGADQAGSDNADAARAAQAAGFSYLNEPLRRRKSLANASAAGLHIEELRPRDEKACAEIEKLATALF